MKRALCMMLTCFLVCLFAGCSKSTITEQPTTVKPLTSTAVPISTDIQTDKHLSVWNGDIAEGFEEGLGTIEYPYIIASAEQLAYLAYYVNSGRAFEGEVYVMSCDIDLNSKPWTPIGTPEHPFMGVFYGCCSIIEKMVIEVGCISNYENEYIGFFGYAEDASIEEVFIKDAYLSSYSNNDVCMGALVGYLASRNKGVRVSGCVASYKMCWNAGSIRDKRSGSMRSTKCEMGGLVGGVGVYGANVEIISSVASGHLEASTERYYDSHVGGIVGRVNSKKKKGCRIDSCLSLGYLQATGDIYLGGICGSCEYKPDYSESERGATIDNCVSGAYIDSLGKREAGGVIGKSSNTIISNSIFLKNPNNVAKKSVAYSDETDTKQINAYPPEAFLNAEKYNVILGPNWMSSDYITKDEPMYLDEAFFLEKPIYKFRYD